MKNTKILSKKAIKCAIISLLLLSIGLCAVIAFSRSEEHTSELQSQR